MHPIPPKKMLIINILDILKRYSDAEHRLSQKDIINILDKEYSMKADRKAVKRNLMNLIEFGYNIEYSEAARQNKKGEEEIIYSEWYLVRDFSDAELRLLIDGLLFCKHIPYSQCKELIEKLTQLSSKYFEAKVRHIRNMPENLPTNKQLFYTIEVLDDAINENRQVSFIYNEYGTDKKLHPRQNAEGKVREYIVNPYQIVATNGRYYLIGNYDKYDDVSNYRLDRITNIRLLKSHTKPIKNVVGLEKGLNLPKHMAEHIYMFSGASIPVMFRAQSHLAGQIIDWFGRDVKFSNDDGETVDVRVNVNEQAMIFWAMQYGEYVEVIEPVRLQEKIRLTIAGVTKKYSANRSD